MFTFVVNYHFNQLDVFYYHLENVIIFILNGFLIFFLSILIFSSPAVSNYKISAYKKQIALIIAIIFVVHPLATQSVTYIIQRQNALAIYLFNKNRIISFGFFWFYITIAIEASIILLPDLFF